MKFSVISVSKRYVQERLRLVILPSMVQQVCGPYHSYLINSFIFFNSSVILVQDFRNTETLMYQISFVENVLFLDLLHSCLPVFVLIFKFKLKLKPRNETSSKTNGLFFIMHIFH